MSINSLVLAVLIFLFASSSFALSGPVSGMDFVTIPAGSFQMGSPLDEYGRDEDELQHLVNIESFELMSTEVTQGMWEEVMAVDMHERRKMINRTWDFRGLGDEHPMYHVSWEDCQEFITRLNDLDPIYSYRLPSESEWEYACRAGGTTMYSWGTSHLEEVISPECWYALNAEITTFPVGEKLPNAWGLYDMIGNVYEWCEDYYVADYSQCPIDGTAKSGTGSPRLFRGGGYCDYPQYLRVADRFDENSTTRFRILGFRVARSEI